MAASPYPFSIPAEFKNYNLTDERDLYYLFSNFYGKPEYEDFFNSLLNTYVGSMVFRNWSAMNDATNKASQTGEWNTALGELASQGIEISPDMESFINNQIARENTANDQNYQTQMRDSAITSSASQLQSLGLSPSNVIQVGGASSGVSSNAAANSMHSNAIPRNQLRQQAILNRYNNKLSLAKTLISTAGSMASSGIYGAALGAIKHSAAAVASSTAHSGLQALKIAKTHDAAGNGSLLSGKLAKQFAELPGAY